MYRTQIVQGMSSSSILRLVQRALRLFNRLLVWLKLRSPGPDSVWQDVGGETVDAAKGVSRRRSAGSWPIMIYLGVALGAPWLIWTMLRRAENDEVNTGWATGQGPHFVAQALYDFTAENRQELSIQAGSMLFIAPQESQPRIRGWLLAACDGQEGLVPMNYVQILQNTTPLSNSSAGPSSMSGIAMQGAADSVTVPSLNPTMSGHLMSAWDSGVQTHLPSVTPSQGPDLLPPVTSSWQGPQVNPSLLPQQNIPQTATQHTLHERPPAPVGFHRAPQMVGLLSWQHQKPSQVVSSTANQPVCEPRRSLQSSCGQPVTNTELGSGVGSIKTSTDLGALQRCPPSHAMQSVAEQPVLGKVGSLSDGISSNSNSRTEQPVDTNGHSNSHGSAHSSEGSS